MNPIARYHRCVHFLVLLGVLAYSVADESLGYMLLAVPVAAAAYMLVSGRAGKPLPRVVINLMLLAATLSMIMTWSEAIGVSDTVSVLCRYLIWLQLIKLYEPKTTRDQAQLILLSLMLTIGSCLTAVTAELGAVLLLYIPLLLYTTMLFQIYAVHERASHADPAIVARAARAPASKRSLGARLWALVFGAPTVEPARATVSLHSGRRLRSHLFRTALTSGASILLVGSVVYVAFPRGTTSPFLGQWPTPQATPVVGFRDHVQLGSQGILSESRTQVLRVLMTSRDDPGAVGRQFRLRGAVLDRYDSERRLWIRSDRLSGSEVSMSSPSDDPEPPTLMKSPLYELLIETPDHDSKWLFSMWRPLRFQVEDSQNRRVYFKFNLFDGAAALDESGRGRMRYRVTCSPYSSGILSPLGPTPAARRIASPVPLRGAPEPLPPPTPQFNSGPIHELADKILADAGASLESMDRIAVERAVSLFMRHLQKNYTYTTQLTAPPPGVDPIEAFLLDPALGRRGHCEYFASALAALCLSVEIPARLVTGYVASEFDHLSGQYVIRQNHAHAWTEIELWPGRWQEFDPSPAADVQRLHNPDSPVIASLRMVLGAVERAWFRGIVSFDRSRQADALGTFTAGPLKLLRGTNEWIMQMIRNEREVARDNQMLFYIRGIAWAVLITTIVGLLAGLVVRKARNFFGRRRTKSGRPEAPELEESRRLYEHMIEQLSFAGVPRPQGMPGLRHISGLRGSLPELADDALIVARGYYRARFAGTVPSREDLKHWDDAVRRLAVKIRDLRSKRRAART